MPQLDPMLPLDTPKGSGFAFWRTDYSQEHDTLYSVIITATREIWDFPQPLVRGVKNISMGRTEEATPFAISDFLETYSEIDGVVPSHAGDSLETLRTYSEIDAALAREDRKRKRK
jgi:hypothetical protein